ncbi:Acetylcholinesterase [Hypsibius exemplaris]|uniref:acetylcholinesterase n=1 Tax=Hypsibius exemplaris TaxID=2072580 RepID=A0A9X6NFP9_HYPEX|nr:Acetylcholinesterase [Hypsibius exemplaris]
MFHPLALFLILLGCFAFSGLICANFTAINDTAVTFSGVDATTTADLVDDVTDAAVDNATDAAADENDVEMFATTPTGLIDENEVVPENIVLEDLSLCNTTSGYIRGQTIITGNGKEVFQYLGIPFAEPPVGELRFRKPVAKRRWEGVKDTWSPPNSCMQLMDTYLGDFPGATMWNANTPMSEDCLYMNIWVPKPKPKNAPVMVWIYGGGFFSGTITLDAYNGAILASEEKVIVIAMQYRLGPFGFFYFGSEEAPGNQGLYDQVLALRWIQENAANFGGHPKYVTLFGESAGAACVGLHLLSPVSGPLFMQAILQSGAPTAEWAFASKQTALNRSLDFTHRLDCPTEPVADAMECLRRADAQRLVDDIPATGSMFDYFFNPVVDGEFLPKSPVDILKYGEFKRTSILLGTTANEGAHFLIYIFPELFQLYQETQLRRSDFKEAAFKLFPTMPTLAMESLVFQYTDWTRPDESVALSENLEKIIGDKCITCDVNEMAAAFATFGSGVFMYEFAHRSSNSPWPVWVGAPHQQEVEYVFGKPLDQRANFTEGERTLARKMMTYWANFARTGNPSLSSDGEFGKRFWPVHTTTGKEYLHVSLDSEQIRHGLRSRHCSFWKSYLPSLTKLLQDMESAAAGARSFCTPSDKQSPSSGTSGDGSEVAPDLLEVEDDWAMEFQEWKRDHASWRKEFNKYVDTLETARKLVNPTDLAP